MSCSGAIDVSCTVPYIASTNGGNKNEAMKEKCDMV